jgi:hypothetical protein
MRQRQQTPSLLELQILDKPNQVINTIRSVNEQMLDNVRSDTLRANTASGAALQTQQETIAQLARDCNLGDQQQKRLPIRTVVSRDPNAKVGPWGSGDARYIAGVEPLRYAVLFENVETATAPAQEVTLTDALDANTLDLATLRLELITFGDRVVYVSTGSLPFVQEVDLRPQQNLIVRISADLDVATGELTVYFASLDPVTGELTEDPLAGFLPPNTDGDGEGSIVFSIMPKTGLNSGTAIRNRASIIFDDNAPIVTNEWSNTVDGEAPMSQVQALNNVQPGSQFVVHWSGSDAGSAVRDYSVFVSYNNGPWQAWLSNTTATSATYHAAAAGNYAFYTIARDDAGNVEAPPASPDAMTQVAGKSYLPFLER